MSKITILRNHEAYEGDIESILNYALEIVNDKLPHRVEKKTKEEKSMLLESLLLRACARWESFVENEVVLLVSSEPRKLKNEMGLPQNTKLNSKLIKALLFTDAYRSFYNVERSKGILRKVIADKYNLFDEITNERVQKIKLVYKIRNYLSHYSAFSKRELLTAYEKHFNYKRFVEPGLFLVKQDGKYFEKLIHNFKMVSVSMKKKLNKAVL